MSDPEGPQVRSRRRKLWEALSSGSEQAVSEALLEVAVAHCNSLQPGQNNGYRQALLQALECHSAGLEPGSPGQPGCFQNPAFVALLQCGPPSS